MWHEGECESAGRPAGQSTWGWHAFSHVPKACGRAIAHARPPTPRIPAASFVQRLDTVRSKRGVALSKVLHAHMVLPALAFFRATDEPNGGRRRRTSCPFVAVERGGRVLACRGHAGGHIRQYHSSEHEGAAAGLGPPG